MNRKHPNHKGLNNPDVVKTDKESLFDMHKDMQTVDPIPVEDLNEQVKDEADKEHTKDTSSIEKNIDLNDKLSVMDGFFI